MLKNLLFLALAVLTVSCRHAESPATTDQNPPATPAGFVPEKVAPLPAEPQSPPTDGDWETLHENGTRATTCHFVDGRLVGEYKEWHPNGQLKISGNYRSGLKNGAWTTFDEDGKVLFSEKYCFGILENRIRNNFFDFIRSQQQRYVGSSCGTLAHECFTDLDWSGFRRNNIAETLRQDLASDETFIQLILAAQSQGPAFGENLVIRGRKLFKKTWAQMGVVSCDGQTEAGQLAERSIAEAVAGAAADLLRQKNTTLENKLAAVRK